MNNITFHCLFEQSGTFKNVFKSYGHQAYDYDILNDYGQTDFQIDLFREIEMAYKEMTHYKDGKLGGGVFSDNIFTRMKPGSDFIIAFFPCTYFTDINEALFQGYNGNAGKKQDIKKIKEIIERENKRSEFFKIFLKFCVVCQELKIPTIIENPYGLYNRNFLRLFSPFKVSYTEIDRSKFGDKYKKATIYFSINFNMKEKFQMFDLEIKTKNLWNVKRGKERSEITPRYADNFYKRFIQHAIVEPKQAAGN